MYTLKDENCNLVETFFSSMRNFCPRNSFDKFDGAWETESMKHL